MTSSQAITWHLDGEHGISSEAIYDRLTYGVTSGHWGSNHPHDVADFRRCEILLRRVPDFRERFADMAGESPVWAALVPQWDRIARLMEKEAPGIFREDGRLAGRRCEAAYGFLRYLIDKAEGRAA